MKVQTQPLESQAADTLAQYEALSASGAVSAARELIAAEQKTFERLFEFAPDGYLVTNPIGLVLRANRMSAKLFGVPHGYLTGKPLAIFVQLSDRPAFRKLLFQLFGETETMAGFETKLVARGGRSFDASIHVASRGGELRWTIRVATEQLRSRRSLHEAHAGPAERKVELEREIDEHRRIEETLRRSEECYRMLSAHLHRCIEEERTRIAREVHDELGAALTAIRFELAGLRNHAPAGDAVRRAIERVDAAIRATRRICSDLRPSLLDHMGLWAAIEWFVEDMCARGAGIRCVVDLDPGGELEEPARTSVFRIIQEAVTNVVRHAGASSLRVSAWHERGELAIEVADNGRGIDAGVLKRSDAFGITGMQERARACGGRIVIEPGTPGTRVRLSVPLATEVSCAS